MVNPTSTRTLVLVLFAIIPGLAAQGSGGDSNVKPERQYDATFATAPTGVADGLGSLCKATTATLPRRLSPGQSGVLHVVLSLQDHAVLPQGGRLGLSYERQHEGVTLGDWKLQPAGIGRLAPAYRGKPVYEDTAVIEIPVTIDGSVKIRQCVLALNLDADVYDGRTGEVICNGQLPIEARIDLASTKMVQPVPAAPAASPPAPVTARQPRDAETDAGGEQVVEGGDPALGGAAGVPVAGAGDHVGEGTVAPRPESVPGGDDGWPLMAGMLGGAVLLVITLLLSLRRR